MIQEKTPAEVCERISTFCCELEGLRQVWMQMASSSLIERYNKFREEVVILNPSIKAQKTIPGYLFHNDGERNADILNRAYQLRDYLRGTGSAKHSFDIPHANLTCLEIGKKYLLCVSGLREILTRTKPDFPGVHESDNLSKIHWWAANGLDVQEMPTQLWLSKQHKKTDSDPRDVSEYELAMKTCAESALKKLSGDLSYDDVAEVKQLMKNIIDYT